MNGMKNHVIRRFLSFVIALAVIICSTDTSALLTYAAANISATGVNLNHSMYTVVQGKTVSLIAKVTPTNATNKKIAWESSDEKIATVSDKGVVKGLEVGDALITATVTGTDLKAECRVTVGTPVSKVDILSPKKLTIEVGDAVSISANAMPAEASNKELKYSSNKPEIATVDADGTVKALKAGAATITVEAKDGSKKKATVSVKVYNHPEISLNYPMYTVKKGKNVSLKAKVTPNDAPNKKVAWESSNELVATVSDKGVVKAIEEGNALITATVIGTDLKAECEVTVGTPVSKVDLSSPKTLKLEVEDTASISAAVSPSEASNKGLKYTSNKPEIATVDADGTVKALKAGAATITVEAKDGSKKKATVSVKVYNHPEINLNYSMYTVKKGKDVSLKAKVTPNDAPNKKVTWKSSNELVATVSDKGVVKAVEEGYALITATVTGTDLKAECEVTVGTPVSSVVLSSPKTISIETGFTSNICADVLPQEASNKDLTYSSNRPEIATVNAKGKVKAIKAGTATITISAKDGSKKKAVVTVKVLKSSSTGKEYTLTIYDGTTMLKEMQLAEKYLLSDISSPYQDDKIFLGFYYDQELTNKIGPDDLLLSDLTLYASYGDATPLTEGGSSNFTSAVDVSKDFYIVLDAHSDTAKASDVSSAIKLNNLSSMSQGDDSEAIQKDVLVVEPLNDGKFKVSVENGFQEGATYKLEITGSDNVPELTFDGASKDVIYYNFTVAKEEVLNVSLDEKLKYLQASKLSMEDSEQALSYSGLYQAKTDEAGNQVYEATDAYGTFSYDKDAYIPGDIVAVYNGEKPDDRNLNTLDSNEDSKVAYLEITDVNTEGEKAVYFYKSAQAMDVLFTPDVLPVDIDEGDGSTGFSIDGTSITVETSKLDFKTGYESIGLDYMTVVDPGDYLAFYSGTYGVDSMVSKGYGKIASVSEKGSVTIVNYTNVSEEEVIASMDLYSRSDVSDEQLDQINQQAVADFVSNQLKESSFIEESGVYLASLAVETDEVKELLGEKELSIEDCSVTYPDGTPIDSEDIDINSNQFAEGEAGMPEVKVNVSKKLEHFETGKGVRVELAVKYGFDIQKTGSKKKIAVEMTAIFEDEVLLNLSTSGGAVWKTWGIIPYIDDYEMTANIDQGLYTGIAVTATAKLDEDEEPFGPELLKPENLDDYGQAVLDIGNSIQKMMEANKILEPDSEGSATGGLIEKYSNFVEEANEKWIDIVDVPIISVAGAVDPFYVLAYSFDANFVVSANLNVAIGMSFQYEKRQRQTFTVRLFNQNKSKCENVDLEEEYFQFDFYVMGTLGLRAGIRAKVLFGLFSTKLDGVGVQLEAGAYAKLWGYFYYSLSWEKGKGKKSSATGAMYIEIGAYLDVNLCLEVLNGTFAYSPTLYSGEWPIWNVGERENVLDFAYDDYEMNSFDMVRETSIQLPQDVFDMKYLDLKEGGEGVKNYDENSRQSNIPFSKYYDDELRFFVEVSKPFIYNPNTNTISIVPEKGYYSYEGNLTITWKQPDITYASKSLSRTFDLSWTDPDKGTCLFFNTNGGTLIRTQISNPGTKITSVKNPTKLGYDFGGWYSDKELTKKVNIPEVMPDQDTTLYVKWNPVPNQYKVLHEYEGLNKVYTQENATVQENNKGENRRVLTDDIIDQNQIINDNMILKEGFEIDYEKTTKSAKVAANGSTVVKICYKRQIHSVTYTMGDLKTQDDQDVVINYRYGEPVYAPNLFVAGFTFKGWDKKIPETMGVEELSYNAVWEPNNNTPYYIEYYVMDPLTNQYVMPGGQLGRLYKEGKTADKVATRDYTLNQEGYIFEKVTINGVESDLNDSGVIDAQGRLTIRYYYQPVSYDISFDARGGLIMSEVPDHYYTGMSIDFTDIVVQRTGYTFKGWVESDESEETTTDISVTRTGNIELIARWEKKKNIIELYDGEKSIGSVNATYDEVVPGLSSIPTKEGYEFGGFYSADDVAYYDQNGRGLVLWEQLADIKLKARWIPGKVTISFDAAGGEEVDPIEGTLLSKYPELPVTTKTGYDFAGWTLEGTLITEDSIIKNVTGNTLVAKWKANKNTQYAVECYIPSERYTDENREFILEDIFYGYGETGTEVSIDDLEYSIRGYSFMEDYADNVVTATIEADGSTTFKLYFRQNEKHSVSFTYSTKEYENSIDNTTIFVAEGDIVTLPIYDDDSSKMELVGWKLNNVFYNADSDYTVENKDINFIAVWKVKEFYVRYVSFEPYETFISPNYEYDTEVSVLPYMMNTPVQKNDDKWEYKEFLGWSDGSSDKDLYQPRDDLKNVGDIILYAIWSDWKELSDGAYYVHNAIEDGSENYWVEFNTMEFGEVGKDTEAKIIPFPKNEPDEIVQQKVTAIDKDAEAGSTPITTVVEARNPLRPLTVILDYNGGTFNGETGLILKIEPGSNLGLDVRDIIPVKTGYRFLGFSEYLPEYMGSYDINAVAQYEETGLYAVTVKYMKEDADGLGYTEAASKVIYEKPGSFKLNKIPAFSGFTALEAPTITVEENDDNVYEIKYNRKSYTVTWNPGEGELSGEADGTVSVKFGAVIPAGPELTRAGYTGTWKNIPSTMPAEDVTIMPEWTARKVGYDVVFQYETLDGLYSTICSYHKEDYAGTLIEPSVELPDTEADKKTLIAKGYEKPLPVDVTIEGDGSTIIYYKYRLIRSSLKYDFAGGEPITSNYAKPGVYRYGHVLQVPLVSQVKKEGYEALGWYDASDPEKELITGRTITVGENDITYRMKWKQNAYTISYDLDAADAKNDTNPICYYAGFDFNISGAVRENYAFKTWAWNGEGSMPEGVSIENGVVHVTDKARGDLKFKAVWDKYYKQFIARMYDESSEMYIVNYPDTTDPYVKDITAPIREGYVFAYWTRKIPNSKTGYYTVKIKDTTRVSTLNANTDFVTASWMKLTSMKEGGYSIHVNSETEWERAVELLKSDSQYKGITLDSDFEINKISTSIFETLEDGYVIDGTKHEIKVGILEDSLVGKNYGTIKNLYITAIVNNTADSKEESCFGTFARENYGIIQYCILGYDTDATDSRVNLNSNATYVGGIAGKNSGTIEHCTVSNVSISSKSDALGEGATVYIGGIAGYNTLEGDIKYCVVQNGTVGCQAYNTGVLKNQTIYTGGVAGKNVGLMSYTYIKNINVGNRMSVDGTIAGKLSAGGFAGIDEVYEEDVTEKDTRGISNCSAKNVTVYSDYVAGGIMAECNYSVITPNKLDDITVTGNKYAGIAAGIYGYANAVPEITYISGARAESGKAGNACVIAGYGRDSGKIQKGLLLYTIRSNDDKTKVVKGGKSTSYKKGAFVIEFTPEIRDHYYDMNQLSVKW